MRGRLFALLAVAGGLARGAPARAAGFAACFGGVPETIVDKTGPIDWIQIDARYLTWRGRRLQLDTRAVSPSAGDAHGVSDGRETFAITGDNVLHATDLATGKVRTVVDGSSRIEDYMGLSSLALDKRYVYFALGERPLRSADDAGVQAGGPDPWLALHR